MAFDLVGKAVKKLRLPTVNYNNSPTIIIPAQEGDVNSRFFSVSLYDDMGDISLKNYNKVILSATLPNGQLQFSEGEINKSDNIAVCEIKSSMLSQLGKVACDVLLTGRDSNGVVMSLTSQTFYVFVSKSQSSDGAIEGTDTKGLLADMVSAIATIPLVVDEALIVGSQRDEIEKGYTNSIDAAFLNKEPKVGDKFWCLIKSSDNYTISAVAEITNTLNTQGYYPFELVEAYTIYDPTETLRLNSDTEQVVDSDVEFNKDVNILGNLNVSGTQTVLNTESLTVDHRFIVCNYNGWAGLQTGFAMLTGNGDTLSDGMRDFYPAYGIIYDPESDSVRLGRGYVTISDELGYEDYTPLFHFGYVEQDEFSGIITEHPEDGQAIATRGDTIPDGNLIKWDAENKKLVDAGVAIGDITSALDELHTYAQALINGGAEQ